ncbi:uncharacterized protein LOC131074996 isoform X1 [Cryptomeria japonica]|uniref:uncharacterized protein LOC131074996 isoform X1 n=2 Tax=Cryptomeria japonica TaxID=3369 RepID=UPI0027DA5B48|nr:uncharacterized protein LOC131074996 isoform X1 [Cryptomeria japonica]
MSVKLVSAYRGLARYSMANQMPRFPTLSELLEAAKTKNLFSPHHQQRRKPWQLSFFNAKFSGADISQPDKGLNFRLSQRLNCGRNGKSVQPNPILQKSFSNASGEDNLDAMVHDFIENGSAEQDLHCHELDNEELTSAESNLKVLLSQSSEEQDLYLATASIISTFSVASIDLPGHGSGCNGTCIRRLLIKHLKIAGYNAALCKVKWHSIDKVPGGCYEFIDVLLPSDDVNNHQRVIIDIDFQSQFTIARPVSQYEAILRLIPLIFVGSSTKLEQILQFMAEAAKVSLKQSSLIVPPWRKLEYIRAKWFSAYRRIICSDESSVSIQKNDCEYCRQHLQNLKTLLCTDEDR